MGVKWLCRHAVITNKVWIQPELNKDYADWAEHNHTVILPTKSTEAKYKYSVENAVGILEKGFFHDRAERIYFKLTLFNEDMWEKLDEFNDVPFKKRNIVVLTIFRKNRPH